MSFSKGSPGSQTPQDIEAGSRASFSADFDDGDFSADPFDVPRTKNAPVQRLRRWRVCVNSSKSLSCCYYYCHIIFNNNNMIDTVSLI